MNWLIELATGSGFASVIGLFGGMVSKHFEAKHQRSEWEHDRAMREMDLAELELSQAHELSIADKHVERATVEGELQAFTVSQTVGNNTQGFLSFVRPLITAYLLLASTWLFAAVWSKVGGLDSITPAVLDSLLFDMINAAIYLTTTCVCWWFGSRRGGVAK